MNRIWKVVPTLKRLGETAGIRAGSGPEGPI